MGKIQDEMQGQTDDLSINKSHNHDLGNLGRKGSDQIIWKSESEAAQSCPTSATPRTAAFQAAPSMGFSRQEYWSGFSKQSVQGNLTMETS